MAKTAKVIQISANGRLRGVVEVPVVDGHEPPLFVLSPAAAQVMKRLAEKARVSKEEAQSPKPARRPRAPSKG